MRLLLSTAFGLALAMNAFAGGNTTPMIAKVKLLDSPFRRAMLANEQYLLLLEPDRLLQGFRENAGLKPKATRYGGWENMGVAGHSLGHYLSALSAQYAADRSPKILAKIRHIVSELDECQTARANTSLAGYLGAFPGEAKLWKEIKAGEIRSKGFDLNDHWVPWYTIHKIFAGLLDAYTLGNQPQALEITKKYADWAIDVTSDLTDVQWQQMLACEHGGMNESLATLSELTGDKRYLTLANKFYHKAILDPLVHQKDDLRGKHSNTQIPKVIGLAKLHEITGSKEDEVAAEFFWDRIVNHHSYVIGGNGDHEHLGEPDHLSDRLSNSTAETCCTHNMLKLTRMLHQWEPLPKYGDYYERALYNHILASQDPSSGMVCYFVPLAATSQKTFSNEFNDFSCCLGTGMENHTRYGEMIYTYPAANALDINLFIPSELNDRDTGVKAKIETQYPNDGKVAITLTAPAKVHKLRIRRPAWATGTYSVKINGKKSALSSPGESWISMERFWNAGDKIEFEVPMELRTEAMPDNPNRVALMYGPTVLAAVSPTSGKFANLAPSIVTDEAKPSAWLQKVKGPGLKFKSKKSVVPTQFEFRPFNELHSERVTVYLDRLTPAEWDVKKKAWEEEQAEKQRLEARTVDVLRVGEMQPERDHNFQGEKTETGEALGGRWRHAVDGGWFSFDLKNDPKKACNLVLTFWGGDSAGREFDVYANDIHIAEYKFDGKRGAKFYDVEIPIPAEVKGNKVTIRFQAKPKMIAGGLFGARMIRTP